MDGSCKNVEPSVQGKQELFECDYDRYTIRYSRWDSDFDKFAYFDSHIENAQTDDWFIGDTQVGRTWTDVDPRPSETNRFRGIAAYADWPYDVTVKGVDEAALKEGSDRVRAKLPDQIGLP